MKNKHHRLIPHFIWVLIGVASALSFYGLSLDVTEAQSTVPVVSVVTPDPDTTLYPSQTFSWKIPVGASNVEYQVYLGSTLGGSNYFNRYLGIGITSVTINNIPKVEGKAYLRIWSKVNGSWGSADFIYNTGPVADAGENLYVESVKSNNSAISLGDSKAATFIPYANQINFEGDPSGASSITTVTPSASTTLSTSQTFSWNPVTGATEYWVTFKRGTVTVYDKTTGTNPSVTLSNITQDGGTLTLQIWYKAGGVWYKSNNVPAKEVIYKVGGTTSGGAATSTITSVTPVPGSVVMASQTFSWNSVSGVSQYWVTLKKGAVTLYDKSAGLNTNVTISNISQDGRDVNFQIWYQVGGKWYASNTVPAKEVTYKTGTTTSGSSSITTVTPSASTTLSTSQTFSWNPVTGATEYWVTFKRGTVTVYDKTTGTNPSVTLSNITQDGGTLTLQIWYKAGGVWYKSNNVPAKEVIYKVGGTVASVMTVTPPTGTTLSPTMEVSWSTVLGAKEYWIEASQVSFGKTELYNKTTGLNTSVKIGNVDTGKNLYVRIWYRVSTGWKYQDFTYSK